ncbi:hypothetical protein RLEG3_27895 [Rhizobium leguminosarum bv. trifolii WSM1689]|nr:hypothetical protein RLEG3_27895 [Rhizobium leguminosarum bv. trifolii WSM1689]
MADDRSFRLIKCSVRSVEFADRDQAPFWIALAEYAGQVCLHESVIV